MSCPPHHRIITDEPTYLRGVCKRCGDVAFYPKVLEEEYLERRRWRREAAEPVSMEVTV